ncbi:putative glutamine amidotransferase [Jatrophihabitans sp. GAS493]|uniref:gamma-glutamyl-gamma-aminobutyrate hydrolase family protein n=1 Tax=Jatrophihabitans sp. GAS493 TaxID=1907575 RepID=UPI000BB8D70F|nr:gamma-glutamyl-gamma-aminobutyrate hydrolase family protein [Jatrophihabitans sp. GAS493]SOD72675.1 putative glutamine amidotransferase [Jatrophihabitans sp. GAS493]
MSAPRIAVSTYGEVANWGVWREEAAVLHASYVCAVRAAGAVPLLLPPGGDEGEAASVLEIVDGLLLTGGADIDPQCYDAPRHPKTGPPRPDRDVFELALARRALVLGRPILAICRGLQVLNVALGGTLTQHLPEVVGHDEHCAVAGVVGNHPVHFRSGSRVAEMMGGHTEVSAYHHQAVDRLGDGLMAVGWADDGVVEAVELEGGGWVIGVQWHPEVDRRGTLFSSFVKACSDVRSVA